MQKRKSSYNFIGNALNLLDTVRKLNFVHKTIRNRPWRVLKSYVRLIYVLRPGGPYLTMLTSNIV